MYNMIATLHDPKPYTPAPPIFEIACPRCGMSRWVNVLVCDRYEQDGWPVCCGQEVRCYVFGNKDVEYTSSPVARML